MTNRFIRKQNNRNKPESFQPHLEALERREVPATWTSVTGAPEGIGTMMLLSDGTVLAEGQGVTKHWFKLTPNSAGNYAAGTWTPVANANLERLYFGSNVLPDGKVFLVGGEYSGNPAQQNITNTGEIYDPVANTWTPIANFPLPQFGDDPTMVLPDGRVLAGYIFDDRTFIYNEATNSWAPGGTKKLLDRSDEETWVTLPDGSILSYDIFDGGGGGTLHAQRYVPSSNSWVQTGNLPAALTNGTTLGAELGPALLLPDGRLFQVGANNLTALYTRGTDTWAAGPSTPAGFGADDAPGAILPNGHVLFTEDRPLFSAPTRMFDFDPVANTITDITATLPAGLSGSLGANPCFINRMLMLPNGQLLFAPGGNQLWTFKPDGGPQLSWRPVVYDINKVSATNYHMTGIQLNGISQGASYGDDAEMDENYPIVSIRSTTGVVRYARTTNWAPGVVASGNTVLGVDFKIPTGTPAGNYVLTVSAAGISSLPVAFNYDGGAPDGPPAAMRNGGGATHLSPTGQAALVQFQLGAKHSITVTTPTNGNHKVSSTLVSQVGINHGSQDNNGHGTTSKGLNLTKGVPHPNAALDALFSGQTLGSL